MHNKKLITSQRCNESEMFLAVLAHVAFLDKRSQTKKKLKKPSSTTLRLEVSRPQSVMGVLPSSAQGT